MSSPDQLQDWLVSTLGAEQMKPGLERVNHFLDQSRAALKKLNPFIVTIAGTNGKGETALTLAQELKLNHEKYALWTSPHILRVTERFQSNEGEIPVDELEKMVQNLNQEMLSGQVRLSYYEFLWVVFVRWAIRKKFTVWILEVGLGGRLDAVNSVDAELVLLTSISRDHQEILGRRYEQILIEKLGVFRPESTIYSCLELKYLRHKLRTHLVTPNLKWADAFEQAEITKASTFSERNHWLVKKALSFMANKWGKELRWVEPTALTARGEVWKIHQHEFTFYGSHNVDGVRKLIHFLEQAHYNKSIIWDEVWIAFSKRSKAEIHTMIHQIRLAKIEVKQRRWFHFDHPKAWNPELEQLKEMSEETTKYFSVPEALQELEGTGSKKILVMGSYYFVGTVQHHLQRQGSRSSDVSWR